ncbi:siroheme synthase CysG [Ensifer sp.]|uniref:siroheme synthase CysG n=1 Tax=Ensifer sp. TaxID=1872086 RepID=UPI002E1027AD|nr:siroheme synthase CysG [Ensifer sp.]
MDVFQQPRNEGPARMEALAKLPVFYALEGRRVVVAGATDGAVWKAELLAACGAHVDLYAAASDGALEASLDRTPAHPAARMTLNSRHWAPADLDGAALAVGDCEDVAQARAFFAAARAAGVPVNVIDKPEFCDFQFGSIVNRSPVVVAISTDGAAPILAQTIRRKIETLLPKSLKAWAVLAQSLRGAVNRRIEPGPRRRVFWERFADRVFSTLDTPEEGVGGVLLADAERLAGAPAIGRVTLVGAGPGDAELLTLKAVRALQAADVILFDDLVSSDVLELARREAKRLLVGKRGGRESCRQGDINAMMVKLARAGKRVVRLKSGDPMVFGRAGEEIAHLDRENIPVDVVPGVTAASAMASRLGLSLTHRDHAQSLRLVTGHSRHGGLPDDVDWAGIADRRSTTVFYMGGRTAGLIAEKLIGEGRSPETPAVIMSDVSRPTERRWRGTLATISEGIEEIGYDNPVLIAVGDVLSSRNRHAPSVDGNDHCTVARAC